MTNFNDMFKPISVPTTVDFNSTPSQVLAFAKDKGHLAVDCEFIREYITHKTPSHPDDECAYDSCIIGDLEIFCDSAEIKQELEEDELESAVNNEDHPRHAEALAYYTSDEKGV